MSDKHLCSRCKHKKEECASKGYVFRVEDTDVLECTGYETYVNLCTGCGQSQPTCVYEEITFGDGPGGDNVVDCDGFFPSGMTKEEFHLQLVAQKQVFCHHKWNEGIRKEGVKGGYIFTCMLCLLEKPGYRVREPSTTKPDTRVRMSKKQRRKNKKNAQGTTTERT